MLCLLQSLPPLLFPVLSYALPCYTVTYHTLSLCCILFRIPSSVISCHPITQRWARRPSEARVEADSQEKRPGGSSFLLSYDTPEGAKQLSARYLLLTVPTYVAADLLKPYSVPSTARSSFPTGLRAAVCCCCATLGGVQHCPHSSAYLTS
ncbi:unnamed protein product [Closterium sp. NIES-65]|nr:unnamed protein product [Closterium sp. NIES-65]